MLDVLGLGPSLSVGVVIGFLLAFAILAGLAGGVLGLGGGLFVVPMLVLVFRLTPTVAIAASLVSVIATSSGAASTYVGEGLSDVRLGMFLEIATVLGGLFGALVTVFLLASAQQVLIFAFVPAVVVPAVLMLRTPHVDVLAHPPADPLARRLRLGGSYHEALTGETVRYEVTGTRVGLAFSALAGVVSGLLGIGGGMFYVPAMNTFMNVPFRVASATSNFMIGVTATASAFVYLFGGSVALFWTAPIALGMFLGSRLSAGLHRTVAHHALKYAFAGVLFFAAALMMLRGLGVIA